MTVKQANSMPAISLSFAHHYQDGSVPMVEFHKDYISKLGLDVDFEKKSICALPGSRPIKFIGQDKCVFFQYLVSNRNWVGSKGERALLPKSDGDGKMVSAFQS